MFPWAQAAAGANQMLFSGLGRLFSAGDREQQERLMQEMLKEYQDLREPTVAEQEIQPELYQVAGTYNPEMEQTALQGDSAYGDIQMDPRTRDAEMAALEELSKIGREGGLRLSDRVALNDITGEVARADKGRRDATLQRMQARGRGGSGFELASMLSGGQDAANRASDEGLKIAAMAQDNALNAIAQGGQLAGNIRGADYAQAARAADAKDAIARFNAQQQQGVYGRNVNRANEGQTTNLGIRQGVMDANVGVKNAAQQHNKGLIQQRFNNKMKLADARGNARSKAAGFYGDRAQGTADMWGQMGQGMSKGFMGMF